MKFRFFVVALILFISTLTTAEDGLYLHSNWGYNYAFDSVLSIHSSDGDIVHKASWDGKSFTDSPYYTIRLDQWQNETSVGLEWVHYKMYLDNPPAGIDKLRSLISGSVFGVNPNVRFLSSICPVSLGVEFRSIVASRSRS